MLEMQAESLCHICGIFHDPSLLHCELQQKSDEENSVPVSLVRDAVYRLRREKQMKSSCLFQLDDESTISADSCDEKSIYESEKVTTSPIGDGMYFWRNSGLNESEFDVRGDFRPNLLLPESPYCVEGLYRLLGAKNIKNATQNYHGIDFANSELPGNVSIANLPPFATLFETNFSNCKGFHNFVRASALARNAPFPDLIPICDSDERHISTNSFRYRELAKHRLRLKDKNNNTVKNPFNLIKTHESGPSETFYKTSVFETSRSFENGLKPFNCVEETERKSPMFADKSKGTAPVFKNIPKKLKSNKNKGGKKGKRVSSNFHVETKVLNYKETIKIQNEDSTLLSDNNCKKSETNQVLDLKKQDEKMDCLVVQNSGSIGKDKEQVTLEKQEMLKRHTLLLHQLETAKIRGTSLQQNRENHAISNAETQNKTEFCLKEQAPSIFEVLAITQKEMLACDYLEYSGKGSKLFQILQAPDFSHHQEQVIQIQTTIDHTETFTKQIINNSYSPSADPSENNPFHAMKVITLNSQNVLNNSKSFPNVNKIVTAEKSDVNADTLNFVTPRTVVEVKKVALPERRNVSITKPNDSISSTQVPYSINNSHFSQTITRPVFAERTRNATSKSLRLKSHMHQANNSEASNFYFISDPNNNLVTRRDSKVAPSQKIEQNEACDKYESNATNLSQINTPESLPVDEKLTKFSLHKDSKDTIVSVSPSHESVSGSQVSFQNGNNSNLSKQVIPENCKMSNSTLNSKIFSSTKKLKIPICTESSKKEVWHKCTHCWKKFKTVKGFNNHIEKKHSSLAVNSKNIVSFPKEEKGLEVDPKKSNTRETGGVRFEIKMEPFDGKQSIFQIENQPELSRNQESSLLQEEEKWFSCLACCRVMTNYHRMMKHLNDKHSGSFESARIMTAQTFKKADSSQI